MTGERVSKHERILTYLDTHDLDAVLLARRCNFSWYTCGAHNHVATACDVGASWVLVDRDGARVLANNIEAERLAGEELADGGIDVVAYPYFNPAEQAQAVRETVGDRRVASDAPLPHFAGPRLPADFDELRWTLTPTEVDRYREVCADTNAAVEAVARVAEPGVTENQLAGTLAGALQARGLLPWVLLIAADDRVERFRHPLPTGQTARRYFLLATCAERGGLIAACTRLASFGPAGQELLDKHVAVATVDAALISRTRPGVRLEELFTVAQQAYAAVGHPDEWRLHHQGGSCGYLPRDLKAAPGEQTPALAEQAFAWNPSITGTKSEDTILCRDSGPELLAAPTDWPSVAVEWDGFKIDRPAILQL